MNILEINGLTKRYADKTALSDVSFNVEKGAICGLLGPNGAGKTTLLRIINSILVADSGSITVNGEPASMKANRHIGYMPEERGLYDKMRVEEQILYFGRLKGGDPKRLREVMNEYIELFNLNDDRRRRVKELSKGNQQKVQIIATLVHEPELVILDEPFSGFDPINGAILRELISRLHSRGKTVILSSHNMPAIEEICSDIALINHGRLLLNGHISDIKEQFRTDNILLTTRHELSMPLLLDSNLIDNIEPMATLNWRKGFAYRMSRRKGATNSDILDAIALQADVVHFEEELPSLNDIFIACTKEHKQPQINQPQSQIDQ